MSFETNSCLVPLVLYANRCFQDDVIGHCISFLINVFSFLLNHDDAIARSELLYYYSRYIEGTEPAQWHDVFEDHKRKLGKLKKKEPRQDTLFEGLEQNLFNQVLPEKFTAYLSYLVKLPLVELGEQIMKHREYLISCGKIEKR